MAEKEKTEAEKTAEKRSRFIKYGPGRTNSALKAMKNIGKLANLAAYQYDGEDAKEIVSALRGGVDALEKALADGLKGKKTVSEDGFKLSKQ